MALDLLVIAPWVDLATTISAEGALRLANWARRRGLRVATLFGVNANLLALHLTLWVHHSPVVVSFWGHGSPGALHDGLLGFPLIHEGNVRALRGSRLLYAMACSSGRRLGPRAAREGVAFIGSVEPLYAFFPEAEHNYAEDWFDMMLAIPLHVLERYLSRREIDIATLSGALDAYREKCDAYLALYEEHEGDWPNVDWYIFALKSNRDAMRLIVPEGL